MPTLEVFDDIIDKSLQEKIKFDILDNDEDFHWGFIDDITSASNVATQKRPGFNHIFYQDLGRLNGVIGSYQDLSRQCEDYSWMARDIVYPVIDKLKLKMTQIIKSKTFLQVPLNLKDYAVDNAHIDMMRLHLVILYYVIDSDGDTIIYNSQWEKGETLKNSEETAKLLIKKKVTPKQGRVIVFNGSYWHTAEQPKDNNRCVINTNITYEGINANV